MILDKIKRWRAHRNRHNDRMRRIIACIDALLARHTREELAELRARDDAMWRPSHETACVMSAIVRTQKVWDRHRDEPAACEALDTALTKAEEYLA